MEIARAHCAALDELGILPVYLLFLGCVLVLGLLLLKLQVPSSFYFLLIIGSLFISSQGRKAWGLPEKKKIVLLPLICYIIFILVLLKSASLKVHWRDVNSFVSSFALCLPDNWVSKNMVSSISFPCPHFFTLHTSKLMLFLIKKLIGLRVFNKVDTSRNKMFLLNLDHIFWDLLCTQEKSFLYWKLLTFYMLVITQCHAG